VHTFSKTTGFITGAADVVPPILLYNISRN
jgi:hypothetical protein